MKKIFFILILSFIASVSYASKLSHYIHKHNDREKARQHQELQQDMDFSDFSFQLEKRYIDDRGERCRDYRFRSRNTPFRHGYLTVCNERY